MTFLSTPAPTTATQLRRELNARAARLGLHHECTTGSSPAILFGADDSGHHGNFHPVSYRAIQQHPEWARRLAKPHSGSRRARPRADWRWRELDCACSSDALLMNIFCHPGTLRNPRVAALLGIEADTSVSFGVKPRTPLASGLTDTTEVDLRLSPAPASDPFRGSLLVEAKLTETSFQTGRPALVTRFRDLDAVFDRDLLPRSRAATVANQWDEASSAFLPVYRGVDGNFLHYQLIRNALAAWATDARFCVLTDARRTDLVESWHTMQRAVRPALLRSRLQLLTWQELASALSPDLQRFLATKYGIDPA